MKKLFHIFCLVLAIFIVSGSTCDNKKSNPEDVAAEGAADDADAEKAADELEKEAESGEEDE